MKITFLLIFATTAIFAIQSTFASPIQVIQAYSEDAKSNKDPIVTQVLSGKDGAVETGRQQTVSVAAPVPVAVDDDDDDDDDDDEDDIESALDDDDDDDGRSHVYHIIAILDCWLLKKMTATLEIVLVAICS